MTVTISNRKATDYHVCVPYGLYFINIVIFNNRIETRVQVVKEIDDL
ncbi:hypothetical protein X975_09191, partial [Stegodyphus mimosarum]